MWSRIPNWATFILSVRAAALLLVLAALGGLLLASAQAHAVLRSSSPANNEILDRSPSRVDFISTRWSNSSARVPPTLRATG